MGRNRVIMKSKHLGSNLREREYVERFQVMLVDSEELVLEKPTYGGTKRANEESKRSSSTCFH